MFSKLSLLLLVIPSIRALTVSTPTDLTSGGSATIKWTSASGDPSTFTLELVNTVFNNAFAIANNVDPSTGSITISLPVVPAGDGYTIEAVDIGNINNVYATSGSFSIGGTVTSSTSTSASTTSSGTSTSGTSTTGKSTTASTTSVATTTTGFGTTATPTTPATTKTGSTTSTSTTSTSTSTSTGKNGAVPLKFGLASSNVGAFAVALITVIGGAVAFIL